MSHGATSVQADFAKAPFRDDLFNAVSQIDRDLANLRRKERELQVMRHQIVTEIAHRREEAISLRALPYVDYLKTERWQALRQLKLLDAEHRCNLCNTQNRLQVHHRTYENLGEEDWNDLIVLCDGCHGTFHEQRSLTR